MGTFWIGGMKITGKLKRFSRKRKVVVLNSDGTENGEVKIKKPPSEKMIENMRRMKGCGVVVKALRAGFQDLIGNYTDAHITGRLVKLLSSIYMRSPVTEGSKRGFFLSANRPFLGTIQFIAKVTRVKAMEYPIGHAHSLERNEMTLKFTGFKIRWENVPGHSSHYRLFQHICVISDYGYSEANDVFEPLGVKDPLSITVFSDYLDIFSAFTGEIVAKLPEGVVLTEADSVIQSVGIVFCYISGGENYSYYHGGKGVKILEVF